MEILDVPESSGSLLSHSRIYFPGRFHESSANLGSDFLILVVLAYWVLPSPVGRLIKIATDIENEDFPPGGFLCPARNVLDLADLKF